jgi:coenzyme F420-reducing hydrogenase beta subunit
MHLIDRLLQRKWTPEYLQRAVGDYREAYFCHAVDHAMRENAASGGVVTAVLGRLLATGQADGALCVRAVVTEGNVQAEFFIACSSSELAAAQGSKYMPVHFRDALPLIRDFRGRLALVLLPCDARALRRLRQEEPEVDEKIAFVVTLFCGHNSERELTEAIIRRHRPRHAQLIDFRHRFGHWRGNLRMRFSDGTETVRPFADFSVYQNLFLFSQKKCHACFDHTGFYGDLAAGDIWSQHMKDDPIKRTAVLSRSARASSLIAGMFADGTLAGYPVTISDVCDGQSRALPFHFNVSARARVSRLFGMRLKDLTHQPFAWNEVAAAFFVMLNERITRSAVGRRLVLSVPRPLLKAYLLFLKGLESL